jgi:hypothetical protein
VIIVLLGLCTCYGQNAEDYNEGNDQSAVVSAKKNQDVSILKQIHRHNEDGSYTYGYEGSDGSFKIETKTVTGEVTGKYGYVDDSGKLRVVEYGANRYGFQPSGEGITVPSPTLVELRPEEDEQDEEPAPVPAKRPSPAKPTKPLFRNNNNNRPESDVGFTRPQQPSLKSQPISVASDFDDGEWTAQPPSRPQQSAPSHRPAPRPNKLAPPVSGSFRAVPVEQPSDSGPSASFESVQDFGGRRPTGNRPAAHASSVDHSYQTFEEHQEPMTEPPTLYQPVARPAAKRTGTAQSASRPAAPQLSTNYRTAPRQMRTSGVLDQLAEQYALPESRSPVSHDFSFGSDS